MATIQMLERASTKRPATHGRTRSDPTDWMQRFRVEREKRDALDLELSPQNEPAQKRIARASSDVDIVASMPYTASRSAPPFDNFNLNGSAAMITYDMGDQETDEAAPSTASAQSQAWTVEEDLLILELVEQFGRYVSPAVFLSKTDSG
eukprot:scaffold35772_cov44-Tisochrysis_lutea.AAC.3